MEIKSSQPADEAKLRSGSVNIDGTRGKLYFTIGLPCSGKSTRANRWVTDDADLHYGLYGADGYDYRLERPRVVIGGDDFRIGTHSLEYLRTSEGLVFAQMDTAVRALLYRGFDVLIDETCTTEATLLRYYLMDFGAEAIIIDVSSQECIRRAKETGRDYLIPCIEQMQRQKDELLKDWPLAAERVKQRIFERYPNSVVRS